MTDPSGLPRPRIPPAYPTRPIISAIADISGTVTTDIICRKCGYNLRGLQMTGRCPECATPVGLSVQGDLLRFADPNWLGKLRSGVNFIIAAVIGFIIVAFVTAMLRGSARPLPPLLNLGVNLLFISGGYLLTERDPSGLGEDQYGGARRIIRICLLASLAGDLLSCIQGLAPPLHRPLSQILTLVVLLIGIIGVVGQFAQLRYLSRLALRIPDLKLSGRAIFLMWAVGFSYGALIVLAGIVVLVAMNGAFGAISSIGCGAGIAGLALFVFGIMYLLMLEKFGRAFKQAQLGSISLSSIAAT